MARDRVPPPPDGASPAAAETVSPEAPAAGEAQAPDSPKPPAPTPGTSSAPDAPGLPPEEATREAVAKGRARRQAVLHRRRRSRLSETQQWLFVALALAFALAWILGRDACTQTITKTYGTLDPQKGASPGALPPRRRALPAPPPDAGPADDW